MWFGNKILYKKNNCNIKKKRYLFFTQKEYDNFIKANQNNTKDYSLNKSNINKCLYPIIWLWIKLQKWYDNIDDKFISLLIMIFTLLTLIGTILLIWFEIQK